MLYDVGEGKKWMELLKEILAQGWGARSMEDKVIL